VILGSAVGLYFTPSVVAELAANCAAIVAVRKSGVDMPVSFHVCAIAQIRNHDRLKRSSL
jgi:hypothetical protein